MPRSKFTLIEVLVVVAIIGILASLLLPSLSKARAKARLAVCTNQEKQIGYAFALYQDDNEGYYPIGPNTDSPVAWTDLLGLYDGRKLSQDDMDAPRFTSDDGRNIDHSLYACPSNIQKPPAATKILSSYGGMNHFDSGPNRSVMGFAGFYNHDWTPDDHGISTASIGWSVNSSDILNHSKFIAITEMQNGWNDLGRTEKSLMALGYITQKYSPVNADSTLGLNGGIKGFFPHDPKAYKLNLLHADGHVQLTSFPSTLTQPEIFFNGVYAQRDHIKETPWNAVD